MHGWNFPSRFLCVIPHWEFVNVILALGYTAILAAGPNQRESTRSPSTLVRFSFSLPLPIAARTLNLNDGQKGNDDPPYIGLAANAPPSLTFP
ncbi:hypothetical protein BO85DRAFT_448451 [Aspergillus piperis CBS 112811]|uniref:Uncharacterized protein n=1 Tax=Aspergillus piperis CBS 112811 TaxID=1448313 RepID=A0A8G1VM18_9EURO|nr:hypothetical protein BO85DRAFT_448451 [Aspergillus piperis CBS 112811]RAH58384.1 hypothetical protein BO85DRAFT_448451 [Aspergillus piperis CBS 112811]